MDTGLMINAARLARLMGELNNQGKDTFTATVVEVPSHDCSDVESMDSHYEDAATDGLLRVSQPAPRCSFTGMKIYTEAQKEFDRIRTAHRTLAPTGCTRDFCQSGRMVRINEPRVGRDRPLAEVQQEAVDFLRECRDHHVIQSDKALDERIREALLQISNTAISSNVTDRDGHVSNGLAGGTWYQYPEELEYGVKASWRNARRCIMRSEYEHLTLCDLRRVRSSKEMACTIAKGMQKAFNRGHILPTVYVFPPRDPGKRGPMIWNRQIMAFAGYRQEDGSILGDPANVDLTERMVEFGWMPPIAKSRWDFLPLITMAENDSPYMMELPAELRRTIQITHPRYEKEFSELGLRWVSAPALSGLGFDIGGNQYTASPFIGWFMDAEIGVRNLADTFRYNALPDVVNALGLSPEPETSLDDLPEYMRMVALSRAQAELNFAVYYSYLRDHVTMVDTLSSSIGYKNFDEDRSAEVGYRLPADPYWLAPPQGSIVPLWHDGGAPNYQPKPMICRHVQDPIKAWLRETPVHKRPSQKGFTKTAETNESRPRIKIFFCSAGVNAGKMAHRLHEKLRRLVHELHSPFKVEREKALNQLVLSEAGPEDIILIIASTTGRGEIPRNSQAFVQRYKSANPLHNTPRFSCFANGDSTYGDSYNAAGKTIQQLMTKMGCRPLLGQCFEGDTALHNPDWESFNHWLENINRLILGNHYKIDLPKHLTDMEEKTTVLREMPTAKLVRMERVDPNGLLQITLDIGDQQCKEMDHIKILAPNPDHEVESVLAALDLSPDQTFDWHDQPAGQFLSRFVDLDHSFKHLHWYPDFNELPEEKQEVLKKSKASAIFAELTNITYDAALVENICKDLASIVPRLYSVASSPAYTNSNAILGECSGNMVDIIVKVNPGGRFSDTFLMNAQFGAQMRFSLTSPDTWDMIQSQKPNAPFIAICTGSGIGPVRALLQRRIIDLERTVGDAGRPRTATGTCVSSVSSTPRRGSACSVGSGKYRGTKPINHHAHLGVANTRRSVNLFAGFKKEDTNLIHQIIDPALHVGILDIVELRPSNPLKIRIQDHLMMPHVRGQLERKLRDPSSIVFVCANDSAADGSVANLNEIVGADVKELLGDRYIEEIFRS